MDEAGSPAEARTILHVDMDAFYASVEVLLDPSLTGQAVIVGGTGDRGVVASCSYEARVFGVRSAMPSGRARRLCPGAVFLAGKYDRYAEFSRRIHQVFESVTPLVEGISLDEAFLDVTGARRLLGDGPAIAHLVRERIRDDIGLWASVGVARSKLLAKLASEEAKPTASARGIVAGKGIMVVAPGTELSFLHPLPVRALWGVGPATYRRLERFGVRTIGDLAGVPVESLVASLGPALGRHLHDLSWARDDRAVEPDRAVKSISHEETYAHDIADVTRLKTEAVRLGDAVGRRLRAAGLMARTVTIKVRFHDFATITRSHTVRGPIDTGAELAAVAAALLDSVDPSPGVRLFGVAASGLESAGGRQLTLDLESEGEADEPAPAWTKVTDAIDSVRQRYGEDAVGPASLVTPEGLRVKRQGDTQWGPSAGAGSAPP